VARNGPARSLAVVSDASFLAAFGGGVVSFLSPCVLPVVPGYLSVVSGLTAGEIRNGGRQHMLRIATTTGQFVLGFTVVFVMWGLGASAVGQALVDNKEVLTRISGAVVLVLALYLMGSQFLMAPSLYQEARFHPHLERFGPFAAPVAGAAFAFGWSPCIGPVLGSILTIASTESSLRSGLLLATYSAGLGIPFLAVGLAMGRLATPLAWVKRNLVELTILSATVMAAFGVVLVFDRMVWLTQELSELMDAVGLGRLLTLG
jgi:cytochrome c-type biogenesis protein